MGTTGKAAEATSDPRLARALEQLGHLLVPGETIESYAVQRRLFAVFHRRALVAATSGRLIVIERGLFGGLVPASVRWQDLEDARVEVGMFGLAATLTISFFRAPDLAIAGSSVPRLSVTGLQKDQAEAVYRVCQAQDQAWREKRRVRELEEMRAKSGGIQLGAPVSAFPAASGASQDDDVIRLEKAKTMLQKGLISDSEFEALKARIINSF